MKKFILILMAIILLLTACQQSKTINSGEGNVNLSTYPIEGDVKLTYFKGMSANITTLVDNFKETNLAKEYEKRTGVKIEYLHPGAGAATESINLMIASDELPDIIENQWVTGYPGGPTKAINDDVIISLNDYREYAPAMFKIFAENSDYDRASKTDDGQYYGFPLILGGPRLYITAGPTVRMDWLRKLGIQTPETVDDWEKMLVEFKEKQGAKTPLSFDYAKVDYLFNMLGATKNTYMKDEEAVFGAVQPEFKKALMIANDWFNKGLLDNNIVSVDTKMAGSKILTGSAGATFFSGGSGIGQYMASGVEQNPDYELVGVKYPTFNKGENNSWAPVSYPITGAGTASITTKCRYPEIAAKVLDYFYTEEGYMLGNFGIENVTYTMKNGVPTYTDLILNNPDGLSVSQALGMNVKAGSGTAFVMSEGYIDQYYSLPQQKTALDAWMLSVDSSLKKKLPPITPTSSETEESASIMNEVQKYRDQMIVKFITGVQPLDKFDEYVDTLNRYGLERAMKIQTAALKRYNNR